MAFELTLTAVFCVAFVVSSLPWLFSWAPVGLVRFSVVLGAAGLQRLMLLDLRIMGLILRRVRRSLFTPCGEAMTDAPQAYRSACGPSV
jgi:uncharacterized membrane protein